MWHHPLPARCRQSAGPPLQIYDPDRSLDTETLLRTSYQVVFALIRGDPQRPRLPLELVVHICHLMCLTQPNPSKTFSAQRAAQSFAVSYGCTPPRPEAKILLKTPPLSTSGGGILGVARFEIVVKSVGDNEYRTEQYWTKFFLRISPLVPYEIIADDRSKLVWPFMQPDGPLPGTVRSSVTTKEPSSRVRHAIIDSSHELWQAIKPGDSLEIVMIPFRPWASIDMCDVVIRVYEAWEPSSVMLRLAETNGPTKPPYKNNKPKLRRFISRVLARLLGA
ncbi:hypothetical protein BDV93DRAFT_563126 [Ceratobasidium sp. AG-I]|nr:hypothetical protein BDV93DRAFT_563126 [Ceratobasidium sp. AG-I]